MQYLFSYFYRFFQYFFIFFVYIDKKIIKLTVFNLFIRKLDDYKIKIMYIFSQIFSENY